MRFGVVSQQGGEGRTREMEVKHKVSRSSSDTLVCPIETAAVAARE